MTSKTKKETVDALSPDELKQAVIDKYDPDLVIEILDLSTEELLSRFDDVLWERRFQFDELYDLD